LRSLLFSLKEPVSYAMNISSAQDSRRSGSLRLGDLKRRQSYWNTKSTNSKAEIRLLADMPSGISDYIVEMKRGQWD